MYIYTWNLIAIHELKESTIIAWQNCERKPPEGRFVSGKTKIYIKKTYTGTLQVFKP